MRFIRSSARFQHSFLSLDDRIGQDNVIRYIDEVCNSFISSNIHLFDKGNGSTGRKAYYPGDVLKLFVYGYFNGISSSRKLEKECLRNIEVQWLMEGLAPDHKTISDFRKNNPELIRGLFIFLMGRFKEQGLATGRSIAVDGTKIKAYAAKEIRLDGLKKKLENIEGQLSRYLDDLASIDEAEDTIEELEEKKERLSAEVEELELKKKACTAAIDELKGEGLDRKCTTDPDAKTMKARYGTFYGYNFQIAVDTESHMVTDYLVVGNQNDKGLLAPMVEGSEQVMGQKSAEVLADAGYYKITEIAGLEAMGAECFVAVNRTASQIKDRENGLEFIYDSGDDRYTCSAGRFLDYHRKKTEKGEEKLIYKSRDCTGCALVDVCTKAGTRTYTRNTSQDWLDGYTDKMGSEKGKEMLTRRRSVAEHPFGTMKYYMGQIPVLLRGKEKVSSEMGLYTIAYNLKRYIAIKARERHKNRIKSDRLTAPFFILFKN